MILGAVGAAIDVARLASTESWRSELPQSVAGVLAWRRPWNVAGLDAGDLTAASAGSWLQLCGNPLLNTGGAGNDAAQHDRAAWLLAALGKEGISALRHLDGSFVLAWWDAAAGVLHLARDRFGAEPLFYSAGAGGLAFASRARDLARVLTTRPGLSRAALAEYLTYAYIPGNLTLYDGIVRVPAGGHVQLGTDGRVAVSRWYRLSFANTLPADETLIRDTYRNLLEAAVVRRLGNGRMGVLLSGGMDSSSAVTFARRNSQEAINSFGFRCAGNSFDESHYARSLAAELNVQHSEVEYGEREALAIVDAIGNMEVPFCDVGIEIGTWILARAASGKVDYLLTGDGGDEIWASHPVYAAQKMLRYYDALHVPVPLRRLLTASTSWVRDSDQKRNLAVVAKRLLPAPTIPDELGHFRWRVYVTREALGGLLSDKVAAEVADYDTYQVVRDSFAGYDGPDDNLSRWMYSDYTTASSFYFSRLLFARQFGVEVRTPFFDRELVEFGARIPAELKLEGVERTKRLFRESMQGVLPDVINQRKDKLGHSVPLKNWLRGSSALGAALKETLRSDRFRNRNLIRPEAVERLLAEHEQRRDNRSHVLWSLFVLEHWLRLNMD